MIHSVGSDLASFKALKFKSGLNILLADKSEGATDRQSRNGAGKTSFVELIHFLLGADARKDSIFRSEALTQWAFDVTIDVGDDTITATRSGARPSRILLNGAVEDWPIPPAFDIDGQRSKGITNMQIFCFDLMLTEISRRHGLGPGFLIHDSHLFDGVDERQVAKALQLGAERAGSTGFQYIVTMNSDALPSEGFKSGFDIQRCVLDTKLTDATDTGGLFGLRFD